MNSLRMRSCTKVRELKLIGLKRATKILNSFMLMLQIGENKTQFWGFGMNLGDGVRRRKVLRRLL